MKRTSTPEKMTTVYLAFLTRGDKWTPEKTPQTEAIQKAHMDNINRLAETKKLVVAGPFGDNGTLRGIFVFKVGSLAEAKALAETDPAVQAGRLALDIHPWLIPEGSYRRKFRVSVSRPSSLCLVELQIRSSQSEPGTRNSKLELETLMVTVNITRFSHRFTDGVSSIDLKSSPTTGGRLGGTLGTARGLRDRSSRNRVSCDSL